MRPRGGLRAFLVAALLAAVGAASTLDGEAANFVGGDDGDALAIRRQDEPALFADAGPRLPDPSAAPRPAPFLAELAAPRTVEVLAATLADAPAPAGAARRTAVPRLASRAPPAL